MIVFVFYLVSPEGYNTTTHLIVMMISLNNFHKQKKTSKQNPYTEKKLRREKPTTLFKFHYVNKYVYILSQVRIRASARYGI